MLMNPEKLHILARLTSSPLTLPSLTCFPHSSSLRKPFADMCQTWRRQALLNVCVYLTDYTIIFSKFEPFELDREQKMVWIIFY